MNAFDPEAVRRALREEPTVAHAARRLGIPHRTLLDRIGRGIYGPDAKQIVGAEFTPAEAPPVDEGPTTEDMLRRELKTLKAALEQHRSRAVSAAVLEKAIRQAVAASEACQLGPHPEPEPADPDAHHRFVLLLSDFHGGERVDPGAVHGLNAYDWAIQEERVREVVDAIYSHQRNAPPLTGIDVLFLGDMCSGAIHKELAETNEYGAAEQAVRMGHLMTSIVQHLYPCFDDVRVAGVVGNHGRLDKAPAAKEIHQNWDWVAYKLMEALLAHWPVEMTFPESASYLHEVAGKTIYVWHGDGIRSTMPGVPWGGVVRRTNEIVRSHADAGIKIDYFACGHFHQPNVVRNLFMNGSLKGTDEWVQKAFGGGAPPTQLLLEFDERKGRLTAVRYLTPTAGLGS